MVDVIVKKRISIERSVTYGFRGNSGSGMQIRLNDLSNAQFLNPRPLNH